MYYVIAIARDYNIAISPTRVGTLARFRSRLENCNGGLFRVDCDIDITYNWSDETPGSGTNTVTLTSGSNTVFDTPSGYNLTSLEIVSVSGPSCTYNDIGACTDTSITTTTTTTTTTTSTTTTTTTVAPASYSDPILKFDQYSGSYNTSTLEMPNLGTQTSIKLIKNPPTVVTPSGSGVSSYLYMESFYYPDTNTWYNNFATSDTISLYNKSFSIGFLFSADYVDNNQSFGLFSILSTSSPASSIHCFKSSTPRGDFLRINLSSVGNPFILSPLDTGRIDNPVTTWNYVVFTWDKNASGNNVAKLYVNSSLTNFDSISNPSTYFSNTQYRVEIGLSEDGIKFGAFSFWDNTVLNQAQVQNLSNEYDSRYGLG
jgi:hypothetical protein